jgi:8-oxo-dGTP diphosphatase
MAINRPALGVSALVRNGDSLLLVKRGRPPMAGMWSLPGGHVEAGEPLADAARREVAEETGIRVTGLRQIDMAEIIARDGDGGVAHHHVLVVFAGEGSGEPAAGDDAAEARWFGGRELAGLKMTEDTVRVIASHSGSRQDG